MISHRTSVGSGKRLASSIMRLDEVGTNQTQRNSEANGKGAKLANYGPLEGTGNSIQKWSCMGEAVKSSMGRFLANVVTSSPAVKGRAAPEDNTGGFRGRSAAERKEMFAARSRQHKLSRSMEAKGPAGGCQRVGSSRLAARLPAGGAHLRRSLSVQQQQLQAARLKPAAAPAEASALRQSARKCCGSISSRRFPWLGGERRCFNMAPTPVKRPNWLVRTSWVLFVLLAVVARSQTLPVFRPSVVPDVDAPIDLSDVGEPADQNQQVSGDTEDAFFEQVPKSTRPLLIEMDLEVARGGQPDTELSDQPEEETDDDSLWVERRRLERDRALEPPPWLREQPMRRASSEPPGPPGEDSGDEGRPEPEAARVFQTRPDEIVRLPEPSEAAADINKQIYEEIKVRVGGPKGVLERHGSFMLASGPDGKLRLTKLELGPVDKLEPEGDEEGPGGSELAGAQKRQVSSEDETQDNQDGDDEEDGAPETGAELIRNLMKRALTDSMLRTAQAADDDDQDDQDEEEDGAGQGLLLPATTSAAATDPIQPQRYTLSSERLALIATKLKSYLEDLLAIPRGSIMGLYPLNGETLLMKLKVEMLNRAQLVNMVRNYDFARGFVGATWPLGSKENPMPLLRAIMRAWALTNPETLTDVFDRFEEFSAEQEAKSAKPEGRLTAAEVSQAANAEPGALSLATPPLNGNREETRESAGEGPNEPADEQQDESVERRGYPLRQPESLGSGAGAGAIRGFAGQQAVTYGSYRPPASSHLLPVADRLLLAEYLSSVYASPAALLRTSSPATPASFSNQKVAPQMLVKSQNQAGGGDSASAGESAGWQSTGRGLLKSPQVVYLLAMIAGLLGTCLAVKLVLRSSDRQLLRGQFSRFGTQTSSSLKSIWPHAGQPGSISGELAGGACEQANSEMAPGQLDHKGAKSNFERDLNKTKSLDLLTQRLVNLLKSSQGGHRRKVQPGDSEAAAGGKLEDDFQQEDDDDADYQADDDDEEARGEFADCNQRRGHFRSSRSYIKSLIEVLSNARSHISSVPTFRASKPSESRLIEEDVEEPATGTGSEPAIVVSQMDISAAHLILAYMERHLEDKERLRSEWLELNGQLASAGAGNKQTDPLKGRQLLLQRLAKVALNEQNKPKNRNPLVVPFDRNRVRLFNGGPLSRSPSSGSAASVSGRPLTIKRLARAGIADYINASYIHDDDPRKPTHIIAQGPTEQTAGQFWQMIWEQGVSVIVMLTRLNENGQRACHCYWPTTSQAVQVGASGAGQPAAGAQPEAGPDSPSLVSAGRRGSVTSVFEGAIVANGELPNNMLVFDVNCDDGSSFEDEPEPEASKAAQRKPKEQSANSATGGQPKIRFEVHLVSEHVSSNDYLVRNMYIINRSSGETRTITQFHYLAWPLNGVPANAKSLLAFRRKLHKSYRDLKSPILVHCSDGAGRSGTYTLIDIILERIKNGAKEIDPRATLEHLRDQRVGLCSTQSQFEFVLVALAEEIQMILNALPQ